MLSVEEYLRLEETSPVKHEYVAGEVYALAGVSRRHNRIVVNLTLHFARATQGSGCRISVVDVKLHADDDVYYYPDVMVACGPEPENAYLEDAPCLVVEVTSASTEAIDRREKLAVYRRMASLRDYLVVDQERRRVEHHWRDTDGVWWRDDVVGHGTLTLASAQVGGPLTLEEIYAGTNLPE